MDYNDKLNSGFSASMPTDINSKSRDVFIGQDAIAGIAKQNEQDMNKLRDSLNKKHSEELGKVTKREHDWKNIANIAIDNFEGQKQELAILENELKDLEAKQASGTLNTDEFAKLVSIISQIQKTSIEITINGTQVSPDKKDEGEVNTPPKEVEKTTKETLTIELEKLRVEFKRAVEDKNESLILEIGLKISVTSQALREAEGTIKVELNDKNTDKVSIAIKTKIEILREKLHDNSTPEEEKTKIRNEIAILLTVSSSEKDSSVALNIEITRIQNELRTGKNVTAEQKTRLEIELQILLEIANQTGILVISENRLSEEELAANKKRDEDISALKRSVEELTLKLEQEMRARQTMEAEQKAKEEAMEKTKKRNKIKLICGLVGGAIGLGVGLLVPPVGVAAAIAIGVGTAGGSIGLNLAGKKGEKYLSKLDQEMADIDTEIARIQRDAQAEGIQNSPTLTTLLESHVATQAEKKAKLEKKKKWLKPLVTAAIYGAPALIGLGAGFGLGNALHGLIHAHSAVTNAGGKVGKGGLTSNSGGTGIPKGPGGTSGWNVDIRPGDSTDSIIMRLAQQQGLDPARVDGEFMRRGIDGAVRNGMGWNNPLLTSNQGGDLSRVPEVVQLINDFKTGVVH
ncbi:hypothetical protein M0R04_03625 [Candidatus Dojkabacteria bacterium]|nr:hypothetical protein [Candidatus Dojkabacteria bacterium]